MKTSRVAGVAVMSVLITVAVEESRISSLRDSLAAARTQEISSPRAVAVTAPVTTAAEELVAPVSTKVQRELDPADTTKKSAESAGESFAKSVRKMWDNPAGKSMMNQQAKMMATMTYQDFVDGLELSKEEGEYFKSLLGNEMAAQQEIGMKMMTATPEELTELAAELKKRSEETEEEIKKFLNNGEDYKAFTDYKNHLPERQQLDGIRGAMSGSGAPLDPATEVKLVDAMYRARKESKAPDLSGPAGIEELAKGNITATFESSWASQQESLRSETAKFLSEKQLAAFDDHQKQMKEMQMMGLKMAETMMQGKKD